MLALVVGLAGGAAGGLVASSVGGSEDETAEAPSATPPADLQGRIRAAVDRVLPNVVTVIVDLPESRDAQGRAVQTRNVGSGVVISQAGHVVTNAHVIEGAATISVLLDSGEQRPARLVADDSPFTDLAVLSIPAQGLRSIPFASSSALKAGDVVLAVRGSTVGQGNTVAQGVVSGINRAWPREGFILEDLIQTDASVNQGDSGGALVNLDGELVGLLTTVVRQGPGGAPIQGVAFAQAGDALRPIVANIVRSGSHPRPRLGIERPGSQHLEINPELVAARRLPVEAGALVVAPAPDSPAARAGIEAGDIVLGMNGVQFTLDQPFVNILKRLPRGQRAELLVLRGGRQMVIPVTPALE